jgi:hypothetical protein
MPIVRISPERQPASCWWDHGPYLEPLDKLGGILTGLQRLAWEVRDSPTFKLYQPSPTTNVELFQHYRCHVLPVCRLKGAPKHRWWHAQRLQLVPAIWRLWCGHVPLGQLPWRHQQCVMAAWRGDAWWSGLRHWGPILVLRWPKKGPEVTALQKNMLIHDEALQKYLLIHEDQNSSQITKNYHKKTYVTMFYNIMYWASQINPCDDFTNLS